jgi:hypothetical protein
MRRGFVLHPGSSGADRKRGLDYLSVRDRVMARRGSRHPRGDHLPNDPVNAPPARGLRPGALLVGGVINAGGALLLLFAGGSMSDARVAAAWCLVQFLTGVWAGVLGANSPFLHGLLAGLPALVLGLSIHRLPAQLVGVSWLIAPAAAVVAAALMRLMARR